MVSLPGEQLRLRLDYRPDLFDRASIEALGRRLIRLLEAAVAEPERAIGRLDILDAAERQTLLRDVERHRAADCARDGGGAVCGAGRPHARTRSRWCSRTSS